MLLLSLMLVVASWCMDPASPPICPASANLPRNVSWLIGHCCRLKALCLGLPMAQMATQQLAWMIRWQILPCQMTSFEKQ